MKKIRIIIPIFLLIVSLLSYAQNEVDALRYSQLSIGGTGRFMSMAGAFGAVGADLSTLSTNPGGIGLYKSSEFSFTMMYINTNSESLYYGTTGDDYRNNFNIPNIGFVYTMVVAKSPHESGFRNVQIGFNMVRNNYFNNNILINGTNPENSLLDAYVEYANGNAPNDLGAFDTRLAYDAYLIDPIQNTVIYSNKAPLYPNGDIAPVDQRLSIQTDGYQNEYSFSIGANYGDIVYFGGSFGIPTIRYVQENIYDEYNTVSLDTNYFSSFRKYDYLQTRGSGFNFKFGFIVRATDWVRLGAAFHSTTVYRNLRDDWNSTMYSWLNNGESHTINSPLGAYDYDLRTPMRILANVAFVLGKQGLISADYEFVDYTKANLDSYSYDYYTENQAIKDKYTSASNFKVGTEWRFNNISLRGGYAYYGSPYKGNINDGKKQIFAGGVGYRDRWFYIDFAYNHIMSAEDYYPYESETVFVQPANIESRSNSFILSIGMRY